MINLPSYFPKKHEDYAVIYQYWSPIPNSKVSQNMLHPIIASIATLKYHAPNCEVWVIDYSPDEQNWEGLPDRLGFHIIRQRCGLAEVSFRYVKSPVVGMVPRDDRIFMEHLSRPIDLWNLVQEINKDYFVYSDSDIMWNSSFIPYKKESNFFHCREDNSGVFYFKKSSNNVEKFFEVWMSYSMLAAKNRKFRQRMYDQFPIYNAVQDELIYVYIKKTIPELYKECVRNLNHEDNFNPSDYLKNINDISECNSLHLMQGVWGHLRGRIPWLLKEFQPALIEKLGNNVDKIYKDVFDFGGKYSLETIKDGILWTSPQTRRDYVAFASHIDKVLDA